MQWVSVVSHSIDSVMSKMTEHHLLRSSNNTHSKLRIYAIQRKGILALKFSLWLTKLHSQLKIQWTFWPYYNNNLMYVHSDHLSALTGQSIFALQTISDCNLYLSSRWCNGHAELNGSESGQDGLPATVYRVYLKSILVSSYLFQQRRTQLMCSQITILFGTELTIIGELKK